MLCWHNATPVAVAASNYEWGLSFQEKNQPPVPNLSAEKLRPYDAFYCGDSTQKRLYLTFDAGYENGNTALIMDALKKHNAPGTFFVVGTYIKECPDLVKRMVDEGHAVGNHTYHHPNMTQKSKEDFQEELNSVSTLFEETTGKAISPFYRPPEGKFSDENLQWAQEMGYSTIFWSLAHVDWDPDNQPSKEKAFSKLIPRTYNGAIVLLHATSSTNATILDELLTEWEEMGYTFGTLSELSAIPKAPTV
ncbi:MAG: polysaccharide deacetylase family protein [Oscillospiraceae bacterium]|nr:polysaccharide deacetylase family protein [Oscillospiraceae bacterium]